MSAGEGWGSELFDGLSGGDVARWGVALVLVLGGGWALGQGAQHLPTPALTIDEPEPAILIDLAPMVPEEIVPDTVEPVVEEAPEPAPVEELPPEPAPVTEPPVQEVAEAPAPVEPEVQPPEPEQPDLPEPLPPEIAPPPEVAEPEPLPEEPQAEVEPEEIVETVSDVPMPVMMSPRLQQRRENTPAKPRPVVRQPAPAAQPVTPPEPRAQASAPAAASTISPQQWQAQALAQLDRRKVYPRSAQADGIEGTVDISFSVTASGQITAVSVARSSGSAILDQAALETARRASPLPAPPDGYANRAMTAAIRFALR